MEYIEGLLAKIYSLDETQLLFITAMAGMLLTAYTIKKLTSHNKKTDK